jgi:uncharacterized phage-associated protein
MTISALSAAKSLCELRDWQLSNLELQKLLYIAEMYHLGNEGTPMVAEDFEAWDYGPVMPSVYARTKGFGRAAVPNVFHWVSSVPEQSSEYHLLANLSEQTKGFTAGQLVNVTHWPLGAWAKFYRPGYRGIKIPKSAILQEYNERQRQAAI